MTRKNKQWGGNREGAGRPTETLSQNQIRVMMETAEKYAEETGKTIDDVLCLIIYSKESVIRDRLAAIKLFKDKTMATISEGGDADRELGPAIYLPEERPSVDNVVNIDAAKE